MKLMMNSNKEDMLSSWVEKSTPPSKLLKKQKKICFQAGLKSRPPQSKLLKNFGFGMNMNSPRHI